MPFYALFSIVYKQMELETEDELTFSNHTSAGTKEQFLGLNSGTGSSVKLTIAPLAEHFSPELVASPCARLRKDFQCSCLAAFRPKAVTARLLIVVAELLLFAYAGAHPLA